MFKELFIGDMFTFHSFSNEVWEKVSETRCIILNYKDEPIDSPFSLYQTVYACDVMMEVLQEIECDNFQPMALIQALKGMMKETRGDGTSVGKFEEGVEMGLAWAIVEIERQATAKDRFKPQVMV